MLAVLLPAVASAHSITGRIDSPLPFVAYLAGRSDRRRGLVHHHGRERSRPAPHSSSRPGTDGATLAAPWTARGGAAGLALDRGTDPRGRIERCRCGVAVPVGLRLGRLGAAERIPGAGLVVDRPIHHHLRPHRGGRSAAGSVGSRGAARGRLALASGSRPVAWCSSSGWSSWHVSSRADRWRLVLLGYTAITLLGMAQFGRDAWRQQAETFSVWFGVLGRMAPIRAVRYARGRAGRPPALRDRVSSPASGLARWCDGRPGNGPIIYDGLSQTRQFFELFGFPSVPEGTLILGVFLGALTALVLSVALGTGRGYRGVGLGPMGAGLLPVALGYLIAHYLSFLLLDGQRLIVAISDPFQQAWDLFGTAFFEPSRAGCQRVRSGASRSVRCHRPHRRRLGRPRRGTVGCGHDSGEWHRGEWPRRRSRPGPATAGHPDGGADHADALVPRPEPGIRGCTGTRGGRSQSVIRLTVGRRARYPRLI